MGKYNNYNYRRKSSTRKKPILQSADSIRRSLEYNASQLECNASEIARIPRQILESLKVKKESEANSIREHQARVGERAKIVRENERIKFDIQRIQESERQA